MKNGPPKKDITIPTGISYGANITLHIVSHIITKLPPKSAEIGINTLLLLPTNIRPKCGITNPINPSSPEKLTAAPAKIDATAISTNLITPTRTSKLLAVSPPKSSKFIS